MMMSVTAESLRLDRRDKRHSRLSEWTFAIDHYEQQKRVGS